MNKFLTILWIIILLCTTFIAITLFKPESKPEITPVPIETGTEISSQNPNEEGEIIKPMPEETIENDLTYTEYLNAGDQYLKNNYLEKAIENYQYAADLNPNSSYPLQKLAEAHLFNNQPNEAKNYYNNALKLNPKNLDLQLGLAQAYLNLRDFESSKNIIWQLGQTDYEVKYYTAIILIAYRDFEGAKNIFHEIVNTETDIADSLKTNSQKFLDKFTTFSYYKEGQLVFLKTLLAKALTEVGQYEVAIPLLFEVIEEENNYRDAWIVLGYAYLNTDKILDAIDAFSQAKTLNPNKAETLFFLGLAYFANNDIENAIHYLEKADDAGFEPKEQIDLKLGDLYTIQEKYQEAEKKYESVLNKNTQNLDVFVRIVWINIDELNNPQKALTYAQKALIAHSDEAMSHNLVGWSLVALDDFKHAQEYLENALNIDPDFDAAYLNLGWMYEKKGEISL